MRKNWTSLSALAETLKEGHSPGWLDLNETLWDDLWVEHCGTLAMALDDATLMPIEDAYGQVISLLGYVNAWNASSRIRTSMTRIWRSPEPTCLKWLRAHETCSLRPERRWSVATPVVD